MSEPVDKTVLKKEVFRHEESQTVTGPVSCAVYDGLCDGITCFSLCRTKLFNEPTIRFHERSQVNRHAEQRIWNGLCSAQCQHHFYCLLPFSIPKIQHSGYSVDLYIKYE